MALRDLNVKIGANTTGFNRGLKDVKTGISGLKGTTTSATGAMSGGMGAFIGKLGLAALAIKGVQMAVQAAGKSFNAFIAFESSAMRATELFGESSKYIKYFAENTAKSLGMAESSTYKFASTFGNLFKNITKDSDENSKVTIAMLKASAVVASKTGRSIEDVMDRNRSGLLGSTEAIEDLGINVNISMLEVTDAFKTIANGRSWEQLTFYEQQQIRTLGILEQAHKNFGDTVTKSGAFTVQTLSGAFKDLTVYAGQFINAGLQPIIKGLTQLVYWAISGMKALAGLFGLEVNMDAAADNTFAAAGAQEDLNEELKKTIKAKQKLAGFDQINVLPADTASAGTGGGTGGAEASVFDGIAMPEYDVDTSKLDTSLENLKSKLAGVSKFVKQMWDTLYKNTLKPVADFLGPKLEYLTKKAKTKWRDLKSEFSDSSVWENIMTVWEFMTKVWGFWGTTIAKVWGYVAELGMDLFFINLGYVFSQLESAIGLVASLIKGDFTGAWKHFKDLMVNNNIDAAKERLELLRGKAKEVGAFLGDKFSEAFAFIKTKTTEWWDKDVAPWFTLEKWNTLLATIGEAMGVALGKFVAFWVVDIPKWWDERVAPWFTKAKWEDLYNNFVTAFKTKWGELKTTFSTAISHLWTDIIKPWFTVEKWKEIGNNMKDGIVGGFKAVVYKIVDIINNVKTSISSFINGIIDGYNKVARLTPGLKPMGAFSIASTPYPKMARGGIVSSPTLAMVGESGKEAVMPLENNTGWIDKLAAKINSAGGGGDISLYADIYLDNGTLIDTVVRKIKRENVRSGKMVLEG